MKSFSKVLMNCAATVFMCFSFSSYASVIVVTPDDPSWGTASGDTNSFISGDFARSGNGSLQVQGDRTRYFGLGNPFDQASNIGFLSDLSDFSFEWAISALSQSLLHPDYTPALRLHVFDNGQRSELIWEGAYNGAYGNIDKDQWYATSFSDNYYQWISGVGVTEIYNRTIGDWQQIYSDQAYISAISIGAGSSVGNDYLAFADNVTIQFGNDTATTFNFELSATTVPAPSGILLISTGLLLLVIRKKKLKI